MDSYVENFDKVPALILPCLVRYREPTPMEGASVYPAVQNLLLAARALGLGTVMTTAHGMLDADLRSILQIPAAATPVALIPIGYPDANFGPTTRKSIDEILRWNSWG